MRPPRCIEAELRSTKHSVTTRKITLVLYFPGRKGIRPVKNEWWGAGVVFCLERGADLHMAQLMLLPLAVSCFSKIHVVPEKGPLNARPRARVCVCFIGLFLTSYLKKSWAVLWCNARVDEKHA